ncbi:hypothetical protein L3X38_039624 [Prunus dulcis]|uniref:Malectin-like domain-containing protein n=1 Tax=Prunus dulcis TaxID=3755 RepID=A0AAD4V8R4_PRUDU|nr:hypothetical protein L3X38_039624 [Prunus dulcis]
MSRSVKQFLFTLHLGLSLLLLVHAQDDQSEFISIDCGLQKVTYTKTTTKIRYISDASFIDTGESSGVPFISAIELRPLLNASYPTQVGSLALEVRFDTGQVPTDFEGTGIHSMFMIASGMPMTMMIGHN